MPRALIALCLLLAGCGADEAATTAPPPAPATNLLVTVDADGTGPGKSTQSRVRCDAAARCPADDVPARAFAPVKPRQVCTDIFGGPQTAVVTGTLRGETVSARFSRRNGCEIRRWEEVSPLLGRVTP